MTRRFRVLLALFALFTSFAQAQFSRETYPTRYGPLHVADFNHDGYYDILDFDTVRLNDHSGGFTTKYSITSYPNGTVIFSAVSDFNNDGYPDIALCRTVNNADSTVILLNNKQNGFSTSQTLPGCGSVAAADFNKDGKQDLAIAILAWNGTQYDSKVKTYFGDGTGKFGSPVVQTVALTTPSVDDHCTINKIAAADFQAASRYDLLINANCEAGDASRGYMFYGRNNLNGTYQVSGIASTAIVDPIDLLSVGNLNTDTRPDAYFIGYTSAPHASGSEEAWAFLSNADNSWNARRVLYVDSCGWIGGMAAGQFTSDSWADVIVGVGLRSDCGSPTAKLELLPATSPGVWNTDGPTEVSYDSIPRNAVSADFNHDNRDDFVTVEHTLESDSAQLVVYRNIQTYATPSCKPSGSGIHVCQPTQPSYSSNTIGFRAAATGVSGAVRLMQLYIDGKKIGDYRDDNMNTSVSLTAGTHSAAFVALEFNGLTTRKTVNFTVGSSGTTCDASAGTLNICSPTAGSTVTSPVTIRAAVNAPRPISAMKVYVDGASRYQNTGSTTLNTSLSLGTGTHNLTVKAWDNTGAVYSKSESFAVK